MTVTEAPPAAPPAPAAPALAEAPVGGWLTTGDHKKLGLLFLVGGLLAVLAGCVSSFLFQLPSFDDGADIWTRPLSRVASIDVTLVLIIGIPAIWIGIATYVVPLQLGATRLALPRLHATALWTYLAGGGLVTVGYLSRHSTLSGLGSSLPAVAVKGRAANDPTELLIGGLAVLAVATTLAAVSLLVTVLAQRTDGMTLARMPALAWSTLATSTVLIVSTPVFLAGLLLFWYDQHYGGTLFTATAGGLRVWQHQLWVPGRPEAVLFGAAGAAALTDVVGAHARRPLDRFNVARGAGVALVLLALVVWMQQLSALRSPVAPTATAVTAVLAVAALALLGSWLASIRTAVPRFHPSLLFTAGALLAGGVALHVPVVAAIAGIDQPDRIEAFRNCQITLLGLGVPLLALGAAIHHWAPKLFGRTAPAGLASLQALLLLAGVLLVAAPGYLLGLGAPHGVVGLGAAGSVAVGLAVVLFLPFVFGAGSAATEANPYGGLTLEWATPTPVPPANFEELPVVASAYPLYGGEA